MVPGIKPNVALEKLKKYKEELVTRERKMEMYKAGEELFALRATRFTEVVKTRKDIQLMDQLYSIYVDLFNNLKQWSVILWGDVADQVNAISDVVNGCEARSYLLHILYSFPFTC